MTRDEIKGAALKIRSAIQASFGSGSQGRSFIEHNTRQGILTFSQDLRRPFEMYLEDKLPADDQRFFWVGTSGCNLSIPHLAESMLEKVLREEDIDTIIDDVHDFLEHGKSDISIVQSIVGITVDHPIEVEPDIWLVRPIDIPSNINRERLFRLDRWGETKINLESFDVQRPPSAALLFNTFGAKVIGKKSELCSGKAVSDTHQRVTKVVNRVCAASCLSCTSSPFPSWGYSLARHPAVGYGNFGGSGGSGSFYPPMLCYDKIDAEKFIKYYALLGEMKSGYKNIILALDRLALSRARHIPIDKAIDLGIALEVTLLNQLKEGELSYRLRTRGAWLLGGNFADRRRISKLLGQLYTLRSQAAHNGEFDEKFSRDSSFITVLDEGEKVCGQIIERIVERGSFPQWEDMTLGEKAI